jgi:hypothetical protein
MIGLNYGARDRLTGVRGREAERKQTREKRRMRFILVCVHDIARLRSVRVNSPS